MSSAPKPSRDPEILQALLKMSLAAASVLELDDGGDRFLRVTAECLELDRVELWLADEPEDVEPAGGFSLSLSWPTNSVALSALPADHPLPDILRRKPCIIAEATDAIWGTSVTREPSDTGLLSAFSLGDAGFVCGWSAVSTTRLRRFPEEELEQVFESFACALASHQHLCNAGDGSLGAIRRALVDRTKELQDARQVADKAHDAKTQFLTNISHEIRTPLNCVIGMAGLLLETRLASEQAEFAQAIHGSASSLLEIINEVLDFSRIGAGRLTLECIDFDLRGLLENLGDMMAGEAHVKGLELFCSIDEDSPVMLRGDPTRISQILTNLVGNAVKFTQTGHVLLSATAREISDSEVQLYMSVEDTGIGIPEERQEAIFRSFTQADGSTTRKFGGTGLGLTISQQLAAMMKGRILLQSEVDVGSKFTFKVRLEKQTRETTSTKIARDLDRQRILLISSHPIHRRILQRELESAGAEVLAASGIDEAKEFLKRVPADNPPRVGILDVGLLSDACTSANGVILSLGEGTPMAWIGLTGVRGCSHAMLGTETNLAKPCRRAELVERIVQLTKRTPAQSRAAGQNAPGENRDLQDMFVLVVEDNATSRLIVARNLKSWGCRTETVASGEEALASCAANDYDLVLMDVQMPDLDGCSVTERIREIEEGTGDHVPIVAMTAHALPADRVRCLSAGMDDYIAKPFKPEKLKRLLIRWRHSIDEPDTATISATVDDEDAQALHFDFDRLEDSTCNDREFEIHLIRRFLDDMPGKLIRINAAIVDGDSTALKKSAHELKGACRSLGAMALGDLAEKLEKSNLMGEEKVLSDLMANVREEHTIVRDLLEKRIQKYNEDGDG